MPRGEALTVGVLPFTSAKVAKTEDQGMRNFEKLYFSYRLISALNQMPGVKAYFSPALTPATDVCIRGKIDDSNGRKTSITLLRVDPSGRTIDDDDYSIMISSRDFTKFHDPAAKLWFNAAKGIINQEKDISADLIATSRVCGYASEKQDEHVMVSSEQNKVAETAAAVETEALLQPLTLRVEKGGAPLNDPYIDWQRKATPLIEQRSRDKWNSFMGGVSMVLGAGVNAYSSSVGNYNTSGGDAAIAQGSYQMSTSQSDLNDMNSSLAALEDDMNYGIGHEATVKFYGHVYHLVGDSSQEMSQFRAIVKSRLEGNNLRTAQL